MQQAREDIDAAIAGGIEDPHGYNVRGWLAIYGGKIDDSVADFRKAVEASPLNAEYPFDLAFALSGFLGAVRVQAEEASAKLFAPKDQLEEAAFHFRLCTKLDPRSSRHKETF